MRLPGAGTVVLHPLGSSMHMKAIRSLHQDLAFRAHAQSLGPRHSSCRMFVTLGLSPRAHTDAQKHYELLLFHSLAGLPECSKQLSGMRISTNTCLCMARSCACQAQIRRENTPLPALQVLLFLYISLQIIFRRPCCLAEVIGSTICRLPYLHTTRICQNGLCTYLLLRYSTLVIVRASCVAISLDTRVC
jgi:hypothetical protein